MVNINRCNFTWIRSHWSRILVFSLIFCYSKKGSCFLLLSVFTLLLKKYLCWLKCSQLSSSLSVKNPLSPIWYSQRVPSPAHSTSYPLFLIRAHLGNIWNANVGSQEIPGVKGKFGLGEQNEAEQRLTEFCQENAVVIARTLFQQHKRRFYTWTSSDGQYWNQIDYILCSQRWRGSTQSAKTRLGTDCDSDYELLIAKFRLKLKKVGKTTRPFKYDLNHIPYDYTMEVTNRFKRLDLRDRVPEELWMEVHDTVQEAVIKTIPKKKKCKKEKWLSEDALQIAEKRREPKSKGEEERYACLNS